MLIATPGVSLDDKRKFDVVAGGLRFEVKLDRKWRDTGNVAVEEKVLRYTQSDFLVYKLKGVRELLLIPVGRMREIVRSGRYHSVIGGDQADNYITLIPVREFVRMCQIV